MEATHFTGKVKVDVTMNRKSLSEMTLPDDKEQISPKQPRIDPEPPKSYTLLIDVDKQKFAKYLRQVCSLHDLYNFSQQSVRLLLRDKF